MQMTSIFADCARHCESSERMKLDGSLNSSASSLDSFCAGVAGALSLRLAQHEVKGRNRAVDQARGPVLQRPLQVEDSIHFLHQRIQECNACLPYTGLLHTA